MEKNTYLNSTGGGTTAPQGGSGTGDLIAMGVQVITGLVAGSIDAKKNRELQEKLAKLSLKQQKELEEKMLATQSELERLNIMYKTFAVLENQKLLDSRKGKQLTLLAVLGGGVLVLTALAIFYKITEEEKEQRRRNSEIVETDVEVISLVNQSLGKCGNQGGIQTTDYNPCRMVMKGKTYFADIQRNGNARLKLGNKLIFNLQKENYQRVSDDKEAKLGFGDPIKNKKWIVYGLIAVAGYLAYKKFKK